MSENKTRMFPSVSSHDDRHKDPLSNESGIAEEKGTHATKLYLNQMEMGKRQTSKISSKLSSDFTTKYLLPSKPVDAQLQAYRSEARHNLPSLNSLDSKDPLKNVLPNTNNINDNRFYSSLSYSDLWYHTDVNTNSNYFLSDKTGSSNRKTKNTVSQNKEILDQKTEKKNLQDSSKNHSSSATNTKKSHYLDRSFSVPDYNTDVSQNVNKMRSNTLPLAGDNYDNSVYKTSQWDIGIANASGTSVKNHRTYTDDDLNYAEAELNEGRVRKTLTNTSSGVLRKVLNQGKFDLQTNDGLDLDINQEVETSNREFYGNKMSRKRKEKIGCTLLLPKWSSLLAKHNKKVLEILKNKLGEDINLYLENNFATFISTNTDLIKSLLENDVTVIDHDPNNQSWLKANIKKWKKTIDILQSRYFCIIFSEEDFSKTYICTRAENLESVQSLISEFLDEFLTDVRISPEVWEFVMHNETFSDLKFQEKAPNEFWIRNINRSRFEELKKEIEKVTFQSYLVNENEYEILCEDNNEILSDVEKKFHVKGKPYQLSMAGDIPQLLQVNPLVSISCITTSDPEKIPLDSLINIEWQTYQSKTEFSLAFKENPDYLTKKCFQMKISQSVVITKDLAQNLKEFLSSILNEDIPPVTIGISFHQIPSYFDDFCLQFLEALQMLEESLKIPLKCYIFLLVPEGEMKYVIENELKKHHEKASGVPRKSLFVNVVLGNLADQQVGIIVNSTNPELNLKYGQISSSLLKKAGSQLQKECSSKYPNGLTYPNYAVTHGYKLSCKYVIHVALPVNSKKVIKETVYDCLSFANAAKFSSIAFPALGTGILKYSIDQVVQEMDEAIKTFLQDNRVTTLKEVKIVLYSKELGLDKFFQLDNSQEVGSEVGAMKEQIDVPLRQPINWIQIVNYSCIADNISNAMKTLEDQLKQPILFSVKIPLEEFEDLFFFEDLRSMIPNIVDQLDNQQEKFYHLRLSAETKQKLEALMQNVKESCQEEQLNITQTLSSNILDHCLLKARQVYPQVKFITTNSGKLVIIQSLDWNITQEAKFFLEIWLGMKSSTPVSRDRFDNVKTFDKVGTTASVSSPAGILGTPRRDNKNYREDFQLAAVAATTTTDAAATAAATAAAAALPKESFAKNVVATQNVQSICSFHTGNGLLVKVYQGDILNLDVDGIVNAANKLLAHAGGVARAIIKAAGDTVNVEGQQKRNGRYLDDGEVLSTSAGKLTRYKNIIHAVGPMKTSSNTNSYCLDKITTAVLNSLHEAMTLKLQSVALPALSSAIFGVPMEICANGYCSGVQQFSTRYPTSCLKEVHFVDLQERCIKQIQMVFNDYFILISEDSNSFKKTDHNKPSSASTEKSVSPLQEDTDKNCPICLENLKHSTTLEKCKHTFCTNCIQKAMKHKPRCPLCLIPYGIETGSQPPGRMKLSECQYSLPGYERNGTVCISYEMRDPYTKSITYRDAYLPNTQEGIVVLKMLQLAFERKLIFTVGESRTTGMQDVITWNDIHHKTSRYGGSLSYGYPDPNYLKRVTTELASHGITPDDVANKTLQQQIEIL